LDLHALPAVAKAPVDATSLSERTDLLDDTETTEPLAGSMMMAKSTDGFALQTSATAGTAIRA
jgi:hypothetical protein